MTPAEGQQRLYDHLVSAGVLPLDWREAFRAAGRHLFVPEVVWERADGGWRALTRHQAPDRWLELAYADDFVVTQVDDGATQPGRIGRQITSSTSMPTIVFDFLHRLDVRNGHRVLEIGTGTGWNAALLCARLGDDLVTTVEIDQQITEQARTALTSAGFAPTVVCGDGAAGWPERAPYDRVIATCAVRHVPYTWVRQTRPGGIILTPWSTRYGAGALLRLTVQADGTATGRFLFDNLAFMSLRAQRTPYWSLERDVGSPDDYEQEYVSDLWPGEFVGERGAEFALGLRVPGMCSLDVDDDGSAYAGALWLLDPESGSWASIRPEHFGETVRVREHGPRRLWMEVSDAYTWWDTAGRPGVDRYRVAVTPDGQTVTLDGVLTGRRHP